MAIQLLVPPSKRPAPQRLSLVLPDALCRFALVPLDRFAGFLVSSGVSANAVTSVCIALGGVGGVLIALGQFGYAAAAMVLASLGDAVDGMVARRSASTSVGGALLDATGDRYQEFFFLGGLAVCVHESIAALVVVLFAIAGAFMVSYSSAKAEALGVPVPPGVMRRTERAVCLCAGTVAMIPWTRSGPWGLPHWLDQLPLLSAAALVAVVANVSAVARLRLIAVASSRKPMALPKLQSAAGPQTVPDASAVTVSARRGPLDSGAHEPLLDATAGSR